MKGLLNSGEIYGIFRVMSPNIVLVKVIIILFTEEDMRFSNAYHFLGVTSNFERPRVTSISDATYFLQNLMKSKSDIFPKLSVTLNGRLGISLGKRCVTLNFLVQFECIMISPKIKRDTERPFGDIAGETVCHA